MGNKIEGPGNAFQRQLGDQKPTKKKDKDGASFGSVMSDIADGALVAMDAVGSTVPGGQMLSAASKGLQALKNGDASGIGGPQDQIDKMWAMQEENQMFNMQYMQLQQAIQADNRNFSTMSNLLKARHDTAKSAINNMHV